MASGIFQASHPQWLIPMVEYVGIVVQDIVNLVDFAVRSIQADLTTSKHISLGPACRQKFLHSLYIELPELLEIEPPAWSSDCKAT